MVWCLLRACSDAPVQTGSDRPSLVLFFTCQGHIFAGTAMKAQVVTRDHRTEQRTLNPRVRGSSPWRRTRTDLGFYYSRSFFVRPVCTGLPAAFAPCLPGGRMLAG